MRAGYAASVPLVCTCAGDHGETHVLFAHRTDSFLKVNIQVLVHCSAGGVAILALRVRVAVEHYVSLGSAKFRDDFRQRA